MKIKLIASVILVCGTLSICALLLGSLRLHEPIVGDVEASSAAQSSGFTAGDRIIAVDGNSVSTWEEFVLNLSERAGNEVTVKLARADGAPAVLKISLSENGVIDGLTNEYRLPIIGLRTASPLERYGIETGDLLVRVEGQTVKAWREIEPLLAQQNSNKPLNLEFSRNGHMISIAVPSEGLPYSQKSLGIEDPAWYVARVSSGSLGSRLGVKSRDRVLMVQGQPVGNGFGAARVAAALKVEKKLQIDVIRGNEVRHLETARPQSEAKLDSGLSQVFNFLGLTDLSLRSKSARIQKRDIALWFRYATNRKLNR